MVERVGVNRVVAVGNGANDARMLKRAALGARCWGRKGWRSSVCKLPTWWSRTSLRHWTCCYLLVGWSPRCGGEVSTSLVLVPRAGNAYAEARRR